MPDRRFFVARNFGPRTAEPAPTPFGGIPASSRYGHFLLILAALNPPTPLPFTLVPLSPVKV